VRKDILLIQLGKILFVGIAGLFLLAPQLYGQVDTGTILGTVKDQSGAVIPNAKVTLTNEGTNYEITKKTSPDGRYVFTPIGIGTYTVTAENPGFQKTARSHVDVNIQEHVVVDLTMVPGRVTQTVEVTGAVPLLQPQSSSVQQAVTSRSINDLPLNGRNATLLARIAAGVTPAHAAGRGLEASGNFSANGARSLQNNYMIDGIDNNAEIGDLINRTNYVVLPPPDALNQFTVQTNNYSAQFGHSAGAVLNASTKSGTNQLHGDAWEFIRNNALDANNFFNNAVPGAPVPIPELRQNQFGFTLGGPVTIPHLYHGKNKTFFFGYYQGTRIRSGNSSQENVPTNAERASGYTDFQDLIGSQSGTRSDLLGRTFPFDTIFDPSTTPPVTAGKTDPVTGLVASKNGYVRDPFYQGSLTGVTDFTTSAASGLLNILPAGRLDSNAIKLLNLYPTPTTGGVFNNYFSGAVNKDDNDQFGVRVDHNFSANDTMFVRYVRSDRTNDFPGPFPGLADGQANRPGSGTTTAQNWALSETHIFSASVVNEARIGYSRLHDVRLQLNGNNLSDVPGQFGIQGIPQVPENGGLPRIIIGGLSNLGTGEFLPSDKWSNTLQATENLTKISGSHTIKTGVEFQNIRFPMLTPPYSRGEFDYSGVFTSVVNQNVGTTGRAMFLLTPIAATVPGGVDNVGGMNQLRANKIAPFADFRRNYYGIYAEDTWRTTSTLTLNFGLRWDYFDRPSEHFNAISNFIPGPDFQGGTLLFPASRKGEVPLGYITQLALDGISFTPTSDSPWQKSPRKDFGPRFGFAYRAMSNLVLRGGYAIFYGGTETLGLSSYGANSLPFLVQSNFTNPNPQTPNTSDNSIGLLENGLLNVPLNAATATNFSGITLIGGQRDWKDQSSQNYNLFLQYQLGGKTTFKAGYVGSLSRHQLTTISANTVATILPPGTNVVPYRFYPHFGNGGSIQWAWGDSNYNGLQLDMEHRAGNLYMLGNFTWARCRTNSSEPLIGGSNAQAPYLPGFGLQYQDCLDGGVRRLFHFSGIYDLPFGQGQHFLNKPGITNAVLGGWATNWILTLQDGEPFNIGCNVSTTAGLGCTALVVPGQGFYTGQSLPDNPFLNTAAFANPPVATTIGQSDYAPLGGEQNQVTGPSFYDLDFSIFKNFRTTERTHLQFRAEFFNLTNTPSFSTPSFTNFSDTRSHFKTLYKGLDLR
jgi:Carboxypeptidase regulatory-like domain/TonB-dependent Receptor Plug Domain